MTVREVQRPDGGYWPVTMRTVTLVADGGVSVEISHDALRSLHRLVADRAREGGIGAWEWSRLHEQFDRIMRSSGAVWPWSKAPSADGGGER
jgi:hypothetical protein